VLSALLATGREIVKLGGVVKYKREVNVASVRICDIQRGSECEEL
jgi:hypothetical protein